MNCPETDKHLRERIAKLRGERSQEAIADMLDIPRSTYRNWEDGTRKVKAADIATLSTFFGVSSDWLLGLVDVKSPSTEIRAMSDYTGLDDSALAVLHLVPLIADMINLLCADPSALVKMCTAMSNLYDCAASLTAALERGNYDYDQCRKDANTSLFDFEDSIRNNVSIYQGVRALRDQLQSPMDRALATVRGEAQNGEHTEG